MICIMQCGVCGVIVDTLQGVSDVERERSEVMVSGAVHR